MVCGIVPEAMPSGIPALGRGRLRRPARKMIRCGKLPENAATPTRRGARFVGRIHASLLRVVLHC